MLRILFSGDFAPCRGFEELVLEHGKNILGDALPIIKSADLSFVNLECPLTNFDVSIKKDGPALKANPNCVKAIEDFSVVGLANNHVLDYGKKGLKDTIEACNGKGLPVVGAGLSLKQAQNVFFKDCNGIKVAVIAVAEHEFNQSKLDGPGSAPIDLIDNFNQIREAKKLADIVIVTVHGGNEYFPYPRPGLRKMMRHFIDLKTDAVICHHPHVPGAYEIYNGKPIVYSLGNFVFDSAKPPPDWEFGYMAQLNFDVDSNEFRSIDLVPYEQSVRNKGVKLLQGNQKRNLLDRVEGYREKLESEEEWMKEWNSFVQKKADNYILKMFMPFQMRGIGFLSRNTRISKVLFNKKNSLPKLNALRCQSHRELLIASLESRSQSRND